MSFSGVIVPLPIRSGSWSPNELMALRDLRQTFLEGGVDVTFHIGTTAGDAWAVYYYERVGPAVAHITRARTVNTLFWLNGGSMTAHCLTTFSSEIRKRFPKLSSFGVR